MLESTIGTAFGNVLLAGGLAYVGMLLAQAIHGRQRHLTRRRLETALAAALGASLAAMALSSAAGLPGGILAVAVLLLLHLGIPHWLQQSVSTPEQSPPILLLYQGELLEDALQAANLTEVEVRHALRRLGVASLQQVAILVWEESGTLRVFFADARPPALWKRNGSGDNSSGRAMQ